MNNLYHNGSVNYAVLPDIVISANSCGFITFELNWLPSQFLFNDILNPSRSSMAGQRQYVASCDDGYSTEACVVV